MASEHNPDDISGPLHYAGNTERRRPAPQRMKSHSDFDNQDSEDNKDENESKSIWRTVLEFIIVIVSAIAIAFTIRAFVFELYIVPTGSMLQTIQKQDMLIGEKISLYFTEPHPGNIITFKDPIDPNKILIKRLIAKGGSTLDLKDGHVYVDGRKLDEPYVNGQPTEPEPNAPNIGLPITYPYTIPDGYIWVMGDNRGNSLDSRAFGPVKESSITSQAQFIIWPLQDVKML